jgi:hypothetical protein
MMRDSLFKYTKFKTVLILVIYFLLTRNASFAQWNKCTGKYANLSVFEIIQVNGNLFGSSIKGILKSKDGITWDEIIEFPFPINEIYSSNNIIFGIFGYNALKVTYSKDFGETWEMLNTDTLKNFTKNIYSLLYHRGTILLATGKGIFKTSDWGKTWELVTDKIIGDQIIHATLLKVGENYFALNKNKDLFISEDYGKNWKHSNAENINSRLIFSNNDFLFGLKDDKYIYKLNTQHLWEPYIDIEFGFISVVKPFCCNGFFISSNKNIIAFNKENLIELPKIPTPKEYDLLQTVFITKNYIIVAYMDYGLWYIPYKLNVFFE